MSEVAPEAFVPQLPWEYQNLEGHDLVVAFQDAFSWAYENGAEPDEAVVTGLRRILRILAWEMDELPLPPDETANRTLLTQHVLHRIGNQGNGEER